MVGVYLLKQGEKIVYVGSSEKVEIRITQHQSDKSKSFDSYQVIGCAENELCNLEAYYIEKYKPIYNKNSRIAQNPDYSNVWVATANKYDKNTVFEFVKECLYFYKRTSAELSVKYNILKEDADDLFLCRNISIETIKTYFNCSFKSLIPEEATFLKICDSNGVYMGIQLNNYNN